MKLLTSVVVLTLFPLVSYAMEDETIIPQAFIEFQRRVVEHTPPGFKEYATNDIESPHSQFHKAERKYDFLTVSDTLEHPLQKLLEAPLPAAVNFLMVDFDGVLFHPGQCTYFARDLGNPKNIHLLSDYGFSGIKEFQQWGNSLFDVPVHNQFSFCSSKVLLEKNVPSLLRKLHEKGYEIFGCTLRSSSQSSRDYTQKCLKAADIDFSTLNKLHSPVPVAFYTDKYFYDHTHGILYCPKPKGRQIKDFLYGIARSSLYKEIYNAPREISVTLIDDCHHIMLHDFASVDFKGEDQLILSDISCVIKHGILVNSCECLDPEKIVSQYRDFLKKHCKIDSSDLREQKFNEFLLESQEKGHEILKALLHQFTKKLPAPFTGDFNTANDECIIS